MGDHQGRLEALTSGCHQKRLKYWQLWIEENREDVLPDVQTCIGMTKPSR